MAGDDWQYRKTMPQNILRPTVEAALPHVAGAEWEPLAGGRTNPVFKINADAPLVCKLSCLSGETPLFGNRALDEAAILKHLEGSGLAPSLTDVLAVPEGEILIYSFVEGDILTQTIPAAVRILRQVHQAEIPDNLPRVDGSSAAIIQKTKAILETLPVQKAMAISFAEPKVELPDTLVPRLIHGDPVPANFIQSKGKLTLIDWQCPAIGDPCEDLAIALSPAMNAVYGDGPLTPQQMKECLNAYGDRTVSDRYRKLAPLFHWRMAAYCAWKVEQGDKDYAAGVKLELAALK
jgi:thiamine kinase